MPDMQTYWSTIATAAPEMYLTAAICAILLIDVFAGGARRPRLTGTLTLLALVGLAWVAVDFGSVAVRTTLFDGLYVADPLALVLKLSGLLFTAIALLYSGPALARRGIAGGEYYVLALTALLGIFVLASAGNLLSLYIGVELLALSLYAMIAFDRESPVSTEAAMKYFVLGSLASGMLLYGISLVYGLTGTLDLGEVAQRLTVEPSLGMIVGVAFVVVAVAFKFGAAPFHMWVPDVYQGSPTAVTLFLSSAPKLASFALAFRLLGEGLAGLHTGWGQMLAIVAVLSMALGNVVAIAQGNIKRMLAYSTISHVGFILLGILAGTTEGYQAALYYTIAYVIMSVGGFGMVILLSRGGFEAEQLDDFKGLNARSPWFAAVMLMLMFSMAGVPPFIGFWAKLAVIQAVLHIGALWLAIVAVAFSVVGAYYYLRVVKLMYFDEPDERRSLEGGRTLRLVLSLNGLAVLVLGLFPGLMLALCAGVLP